MTLLEWALLSDKERFAALNAVETRLAAAERVVAVTREFRRATTNMLESRDMKRGNPLRIAMAQMYADKALEFDEADKAYLDKRDGE